MARIGTKGPVLAVSAIAGRAMDGLSKAAVIDLACKLLAMSLGHPPDVAEVQRELQPILIARGDSMPASMRYCPFCGTPNNAGPHPACVTAYGLDYNPRDEKDALAFIERRRTALGMTPATP